MNDAPNRWGMWVSRVCQRLTNDDGHRHGPPRQQRQNESPELQDLHAQRREALKECCQLHEQVNGKLIREYTLECSHHADEFEGHASQDFADVRKIKSQPSVLSSLNLICCIKKICQSGIVFLLSVWKKC